MRKLLVTLALFGGLAFAQAPVGSQYQTFSLELSPVSLPSAFKAQTVVGTEAGGYFHFTPNLQLGSMDIVAPGNNFQYWSGAGTYDIPYLSKKLNNITPTLNGMRFLFGVSASAGMVRITDTSRQHVGFTAGGYVDYAVSSSGKYTLGAKIEYGHFPGVNNRALLVALDPKIRF